MPVPTGQPCLCKQGINKWLMLKLNNHRGIFFKKGPPVDIMAVQWVGSLWPIQTYFSIFVEFVFKFICKIYISNISIHFRHYKTKCLKIKMMVIFSDMEMLGRAGLAEVASGKRDGTYSVHVCFFGHGNTPNAFCIWFSLRQIAIHVYTLLSDMSQIALAQSLC